MAPKVFAGLKVLRGRHDVEQSPASRTTQVSGMGHKLCKQSLSQHWHTSTANRPKIDEK